MPSPPPIIIKKKISHSGHHGGAWKVAYADFVTAMMALFIVLWLMNSSVQVKKAIAGYFRDPAGTAKLAGSDMAGVGEYLVVSKDNKKDLKDQLEKAIREVPEFDKLEKHIEMTVTHEGLRIELTESAAGTFFDSGSAGLSKDGSDLLKLLAQELGKLPNHIVMEGHSDSKPYPLTATYTNWELSVDRANAARRLMQVSGLQQGQVTQVRGFADQRLRKPGSPLDPSNRRISVIVQYPEKKPAPDSATDAKSSESGESAIALPTENAPKQTRQPTENTSFGFRVHLRNDFLSPHHLTLCRLFRWAWIRNSFAGFGFNPWKWKDVLVALRARAARNKLLQVRRHEGSALARRLALAT